MTKRLFRIQVKVDPTEAAAIEDFRFERRMPSKSAAIREVIRRGFAAEDYGIITSTPESNDN